MRRAALILALTAVPALLSGETPAATRKPAESAQTRQYSKEMLDRIRHSLTAQIAVRDAAEGAMRAPTPEEAAQLAGASGLSATAIPLKNGGAALKHDVSQMSFAIAETGAGGTARITHGPARKVVPAAAKAGKGAGNGR